MSRRIWILAVALALVAGGCSEPAPERVAQAPPVVETPEPEPTPTPTPSPTPSPESRVVDLGDNAPPKFRGGALGVTVPGATTIEVHAKPKLKSKVSTYTAVNPLDQELIFLVTKAMEDKKPDKAGWFKILIPERPNGLSGWVRARDVEGVKLNERIEVDLSKYVLKHFVNNELVHKFSVGVGEDQWPTPKGLFNVWAHVPQPDPSGPYGRYALGISGFSPVLSDWPGGGRAALHGTVNPGDRGFKVSHGCVRIYNEDMAKLENVPMGTPVIIRG